MMISILTDERVEKIEKELDKIKKFKFEHEIINEDRDIGIEEGKISFFLSPWIAMREELQEMLDNELEPFFSESKRILNDDIEIERFEVYYLFDKKDTLYLCVDIFYNFDLDEEGYR